MLALSAGLGEKSSIKKIKIPLARRIRLWVLDHSDSVDRMCHYPSRLERRGQGNEVSSLICLKGLMFRAHVR